VSLEVAAVCRAALQYTHSTTQLHYNTHTVQHSYTTIHTQYNTATLQYTHSTTQPHCPMHKPRAATSELQAQRCMVTLAKANIPPYSCATDALGTSPIRQGGAHSVARSCRHVCVYSSTPT